MITTTAVVTVGRFMHGGWEPLKDHIRNGGRLPFGFNWSNACMPQITDMEVVTIVETLALLEAI